MISNFDIGSKLIVEGIFLKYGVDLRDYSFSSIRRRLEAALHQLELSSLGEMQERVLNDPGMFESLLQILTVSTTEMFRDPAYFREIRENALPILMTYPSIKIWIAGCSTGEEAYSMAILLQEAGLLERSIIYATDINQKSLKKAQSGIFPLEQISLYTSNYQKSGGTRAFSDYYQTGYDLAIFDKKLRSQIVFSEHNLATDTVFSEVELVSCRNVLIYFTRSLQERVLRLFNDSLGYRGFLGLGSKETLKFSSIESSFEVVSASEKVYRKLGIAT